MNTILSPGALRRLARFQARLEGAQSALQAAETVVRALNEQYREAVGAALEDAGIGMPGQPAKLDIDWATGEVRFLPVEEPNGVIQ
jgi:hypothetical protein